MDGLATAGPLRFFQNLQDCRKMNIRHKLTDILTIAFFAVICGADGWVDVQAYGKLKFDWLKTFLALPHGIPSHDTFGRIFRKLKPEKLERCFMDWMSAMVEVSGGKLVAIDGKSLRSSFEDGWDKSGMAHMVSAFVQANQMVFAQLKCDGKGQELDTIQKLLALVDIQGAVVTIDALGCNAKIIQAIAEAKADFVLQVKENQPTLCQAMTAFFNEAILDNFKGIKHDYYQQVDGDHGRIETRKIWVTSEVKHLGTLLKSWPDVRTLVVVESVREFLGSGLKSIERHYYISSLSRKVTARKMLGYVRGHWSVENNLHWQLDVSFAEDKRRIRKDHGPENFSRLCRMALNVLKNDITLSGGIANKRKKCGWNNDLLVNALLQ
jgi:predicted transposase YbfD/YdcC